MMWVDTEMEIMNREYETDEYKESVTVRMAKQMFYSHDKDKDSTDWFIPTVKGLYAFDLALEKNPGMIQPLMKQESYVSLLACKRILVTLANTQWQPFAEDHLTFVDIVQRLLDAGMTLSVTENYDTWPLYELCYQIGPNVSDFLRQSVLAEQPQALSPRATLARIENGRLLFNVYGSDIRDCVELLASNTPSEELLRGIQATVYQMHSGIDCRPHRGGSVELIGEDAHANVMRARLNCVFDLLQSMLSHYTDVDNIETTKLPHGDWMHRSRHKTMYICDLVVECLWMAHIVNQRVLNAAQFCKAVDIYLVPSLNILKELTRYRTLRKVETFDDIAQFVLRDSGRYLPFVEALVFHLTQQETREFVTELKTKCEKWAGEFTPEAFAQVQAYLNTPPTLKHAARKRVTQCLGGTVRPEKVSSLLLPQMLQDFIIGSVTY